MPTTNDPETVEVHRSTLFRLMEAPNLRRDWRFGRSLHFHGPAWGTLDGTEVTALLQRSAQRPHINLEDIARLLDGAARDEDSAAGSN